jgi:starch synthase
MTPHVLSVASEVYPLVKTGGLADVTGALPAALAPYGVKLTTFVPGYPAVMAALERRQILARYDDLLGVSARLVAGTAKGLDLVVLDAPALYERSGGLYVRPDGTDWPDNWRRFAAFGKAAADIAMGAVPGLVPDLLHAHDWQAAMAAAYLHYAGAATPAIVTIHNMAFQGIFPRDVFSDLRLPAAAFAFDGIEYYGNVGFLKAGLQTAAAITTVSPTYAEEIREPEFGMGLEGLIEARKDRVFGIVNGIDTAVWNPATDENLAAVYEAAAPHGREQNRRAVETAFGLSGGGPLFAVVSRLTEQKGMDVLAAVVDALTETGARLAVLGSGDKNLEAAFAAAADRHPGRVGVKIGYDEKLSHLVQGGADAILIPSRFEPCGLTQLYGLRYGSVPVAARTGGLADTIIDANEAALTAGVATGFLFDEVTEKGLIRAVKRAVAAFADRSVWRSLQARGMAADFSWKRSGRRYAGIYRKIVGKPRA